MDHIHEDLPGLGNVERGPLAFSLTSNKLALAFKKQLTSPKHAQTGILSPIVD